MTDQGKVTYSNCQTKDGKIIVYASEAEFMDNLIEEAFFGCGGVCEIPDMQNKMIRLARGRLQASHIDGCRPHEGDSQGSMCDIPGL